MIFACWITQNFGLNITTCVEYVTEIVLQLCPLFLLNNTYIIIFKRAAKKNNDFLCEFL